MTLGGSPTGSRPLAAAAVKKDPAWLRKFNEVRDGYLLHLQKWDLEIKSNNDSQSNGTESPPADNSVSSSSSASASVKAASQGPAVSGAQDLTLRVIPSHDTLLISAVQSQLLQIFVACLGELYKVALQAHILGENKLASKVQVALKGTLEQFFDLKPSDFATLLSVKAVEDATWNRTTDFIRKTKAIFQLDVKKNNGAFGRVFLHIYVRNMFQHNNGYFNASDITKDPEVVPTWFKSNGDKTKILDEVQDGATIELNWFIVQDLLSAIVQLITNAKVK